MENSGLEFDKNGKIVTGINKVFTGKKEPFKESVVVLDEEQSKLLKEVEKPAPLDLNNGQVYNY